MIRCRCCQPGCECECPECTCAAFWSIGHEATYRECLDANCPARRDGYRHAHRIRETTP